MLPGHWFTFGKNSAYDDGVRLMRQGDFESALECFLKAHKESKEPAIAKLAETLIVHSCRKLASSQIEVGNGTEALIAIQVALEFRNQFADLHFLRARAHFLEGNLEQFRFDIANATNLNPNYGIAIQLSAIIEEDSKSEIDPEVLAFIREEFRNGNRMIALTAFDKATYTSEVEIRKRIAVAQQYAEDGQFQNAAETWLQVIDERPNYPDVRCHFGQALLELDRVEDAAIQFEQAIAMNPNMADAYALLGVSQKRLGQNREAAESFEAARKLNPHHPIADMETTRR